MQSNEKQCKQCKATWGNATQQVTKDKSMQSTTKQSKATQSNAKQCKTNQCKAYQSKHFNATQCNSKQSEASNAKHSNAMQCNAKSEQSKAKQSNTMQNQASNAMQSNATQRESKQSATKQNNVNQSNIKQSYAMPRDFYINEKPPNCGRAGLIWFNGWTTWGWTAPKGFPRTLQSSIDCNTHLLCSGTDRQTDWPTIPWGRMGWWGFAVANRNLHKNPVCSTSKQQNLAKS